MRKLTIIALYILALFIMNSCSSLWSDPYKDRVYKDLRLGPHSTVKDDILMRYVDDFIRDFSDMYPSEVLDINKIYSTRFESLPKSATTMKLGVCIDWDNVTKEVLISPDLYMDAGLIKATVYHELGHCLLDLEHDQSENPSFMSASLEMNNSKYIDNWAEELDKFKKYAKSQSL